MFKVIYPGSFDPLTYGHLDIITRASNTFDEVVVGVFINPSKKATGMFSIEERLELIKESVKDLNNIKVVSATGLVVNFMKEHNIKAIVKGVRGIKDFEEEKETAFYNKNLDSNAETYFLFTDSKFQYISSSNVKNLAAFGGSINQYVPPHIEQAILNKIKK